MTYQAGFLGTARVETVTVCHYQSLCRGLQSGLFLTRRGLPDVEAQRRLVWFRRKRCHERGGGRNASTGAVAVSVIDSGMNGITFKAWPLTVTVATFWSRWG
jgi:hypothetical protein